MVRLTLKETVRKKILLITLALTAGFLILYWFGVHFAYKSASDIKGETSALVIEFMPYTFMTLALFFGTFITGFLAIMSAVGTISLEIENGTMHALAPRPIRRSSIVLGKFAGYALMVGAYSSLFYLAIVGCTTAATGKTIAPSAGVLGLFILHPLVLLSVTMLGTTFLPTIANAVAVFMLYALSVMGGTLEQVGYILRNDTLINTGIVTSLLMPADSLYRKTVHLTLPGAGAGLASNFLGPLGSSGEPSVWMMVYAGLYVALFVGLAVRVFSRRDIS